MLTSLWQRSSFILESANVHNEPPIIQHVASLLFALLLSSFWQFLYEVAHAQEGIKLNMSLLLFTNSFGERILGQKIRTIGQNKEFELALC